MNGWRQHAGACVVRGWSRGLDSGWQCEGTGGSWKVQLAQTVNGFNTKPRSLSVLLSSKETAKEEVHGEDMISPVSRRPPGGSGELAN